MSHTSWCVSRESLYVLIWLRHFYVVFQLFLLDCFIVCVGRILGVVHEVKERVSDVGTPSLRLSVCL